MKTNHILSAALFAVASLAGASASARIINESYYPPGEDFVQKGHEADRPDVKLATRQANNRIEARQPRVEFGAGSHDKSPEVNNRAAVKAETKDFVRSGSTHVPFTY